MTLTRHNHHIPGTTIEDEERVVGRARCGGPGMCIDCTTDELTAFRPKPGPKRGSLK